MANTEYRVTLKDTSVSVSAIAKWVRTMSASIGLQSRSLPDSLHLARGLKDGNIWIPGGIDKQNIPEFIKVEVIVTDDENDIFLRERARIWNLLERAAAGDAEAAIEYCRLELAGKVSHGAFAG